VLNIETVEQLNESMEKEFVPVGIQERLHKKLGSLMQNNCKSLEDHVVKFKMFISEVNDMSDLDRVMSFARGLVRSRRQEVLCR